MWIGNFSIDDGDGDGNKNVTKWIRVFSNFVTLIIPIRWKWQMLANFPWVEFLGTALKWRKREKKFAVVCLGSPGDLAWGNFTTCSCIDGKLMCHKVCCTCKISVFWCFRSRRRRRRRRRCFCYPVCDVSATRVHSAFIWFCGVQCSTRGTWFQWSVAWDT